MFLWVTVGIRSGHKCKVLGCSTPRHGRPIHFLSLQKAKRNLLSYIGLCPNWPIYHGMFICFAHPHFEANNIKGVDTFFITVLETSPMIGIVLYC